MSRITEPPRLIVRLILAAACFAAVAWGVAAYPLPAWPLAIALAVYAGALWRWPALYLIVVPAVLPAFDLGIWTGWIMVAESDLGILVTIAILTLREPSCAIDFFFPDRTHASHARDGRMADRDFTAADQFVRDQRRHRPDHRR
jgi:hypothetical protein